MFWTSRGAQARQGAKARQGAQARRAQTRLGAHARQGTQAGRAEARQGTQAGRGAETEAREGAALRAETKARHSARYPLFKHSVAPRCRNLASTR